VIDKTSIESLRSRRRVSRCSPPSTRAGMKAFGTTALVSFAVIALGGCISIKSQSSSQRAPGVISLNVVVCASDRDRDVYATCDPDSSDGTAMNTAESDNGQDATADALGQLLVSFRVPVGTTAPDSFSSVAQEVVFSKSEPLTARMNSQFPPLASATWVGYISTPKLFDLEDPSGREVNLRPEFTLPSQADGGPFAGPFPWRVVAGIRSLPSQDQAGAPVNCSSLGTVCSDSPSSGVATSLTASVSDFGVLTGANTTAGHGESAIVSFPVQYLDGAGKGPQDLAIAATTTLPGTSATPSGTTLHVTPGSTSTVNVTVPIPPATPLGAYTVTLSAATGSPSVTRSNTATIQVVDKLAPTIRISTPAEGAKFRLGKQAAADYACTDETNGTGLNRCAGPVAPGAAIDTRSLGKKTFRVDAVDNAGNAATAATHYTVLPRVAPPIKVAFNLVRTVQSTEFTNLLIKGIPKGSKVTVKCRPKRAGKKCPAKPFTKRKARGTVKLKSFVGKRFTPGTVIDIRVTKPGSNGAVKLLTIRANSAPSIATRCLRPGARRPRKRC
jgi:hypothetical protein